MIQNLTSMKEMNGENTSVLTFWKIGRSNEVEDVRSSDIYGFNEKYFQVFYDGVVALQDCNLIVHYYIQPSSFIVRTYVVPYNVNFYIYVNDNLYFDRNINNFISFNLSTNLTLNKNDILRFSFQTDGIDPAFAAFASINYVI